MVTRSCQNLKIRASDRIENVAALQVELLHREHDVGVAPGIAPVRMKPTGLTIIALADNVQLTRNDRLG